MSGWSQEAQVFAPPYLHTIDATSRTFLGHTGRAPWKHEIEKPEWKALTFLGHTGRNPETRNRKPSILNPQLKALTFLGHNGRNPENT
jgi:hypothetical protein